MTALEQLVRLLKSLERAGTSVMELVCGGSSPSPWTIYPGEYGIFDRRTRSQFYYHVHDGARDEAGHFHTVRLFNDHTVHLVGNSMSPTGWPQALFTPNLWAIGEAYASAADHRRHVRGFHLREQVGPPPLVRFVNLVFQAFRPEIERLQEEKIETLAQHRAAHPGHDNFEDRSVEILRWVEIDIWALVGDVALTIPRF